MLVNVGKGIEREVDVAAMVTGHPDDKATFTKIMETSPAIAHAVYIGLRNVLMDSHASITSEEYPDETERKAAAEAMVDKKLEALLRGEVRVQSTREGDPVRAEAVKMAIAAVHAKIKAAGKKPKDYEPKAIREAALKLITPELLARAKARVEETKTVDAGDLAELGL